MLTLLLGGRNRYGGGTWMNTFTKSSAILYLLLLSYTYIFDRYAVLSIPNLTDIGTYMVTFVRQLTVALL